MVLTSGLKKIIGTKAFYKAALAFAIPLILQDTVSSFVNLLDNMMIGSLGTEQMSGVAILSMSSSFGAGMKNVFIFAAVLTVIGAATFGMLVPIKKKAAVAA